LKTAFLWRHRFLSVVEKNNRLNVGRNAIVSVVKTRYSEKGMRKRLDKKRGGSLVASIMSADSSGYFHVRVMERKASSLTIVPITSVSKPTFIPDRSIPRMVRRCSSPPKNEKKLLHTSENIQENLCVWLGKFRGVVTKYLQNYWAWIAVLNQFSRNRDHERLLLEKSVAM